LPYRKKSEKKHLGESGISLQILDSLFTSASAKIQTLQTNPAISLV
jgi:hypothetical protein